MCDRAEARFDCIAVEERAKNPGTKQSRAHAGDGGVERREKRGGAGARGFLGEDGSDELEIADGDGIEDQGIVLLVITHAVQMAQGFYGSSGEWQVASGERRVALLLSFG